MNNEHRSIIHMDLDCFFVSVECLSDPRLKGKPLIIGGKGNRGVVTSCSYEARQFGVHSAMPVALAIQRCPDAIVIPGDIDSYSRYSALVTEIIAEQAPLFEKSSIDEFYLDVSGMDKFIGCYQWAKSLRRSIMEHSGLPISMGLSTNKMVAKVATGEAKPDGERRIERGGEPAFLAPMPIRKIPLLGDSTARFLNDMGVHTVRLLQQMPLEMMEKVFGKNGRMLWYRAHGIDKSPVKPYSERKSISTENTFARDSIDFPKMKNILIAMVEKLAFGLRAEKMLTSCVSVKVRYSDFHTESKQSQVAYTSADSILIEKALGLFDRLYNRRMRVRLVGVRFSNLVHGNYQINLFEDTEDELNLNLAMDKIKFKYGSGILTRASTLSVGKRVRTSVNPFRG